MTDIIARIDQQLAAGEPCTGFDFNDPQYPRCPHCARHWHGLPITQRVAAMYASGRYCEDYDALADDTPVVCEGSTFIGPQRPSLGQGAPASAFFLFGEIDFSPVIDRFLRFRDAIQQTTIVFNLYDWFLSVSPLPELPPCPPQLIVEFGPQNWHLELQRDVITPPVEVPRHVQKLWPKFIEPDYPVPPSPEFDFSSFQPPAEQHGPKRRRLDGRRQ